MVPADAGVGGTRATAARLDPESAEWLRLLAGTGSRREAALVRLHAMLVRIAQGEVRRRGPRLRVTGPELDDLAHQAAADALIAITGKLGQFRGESRFTTWAYKFVILEVSAKIGRHFWRHAAVPLDAEDWDRLPDRFGFDPVREAEWRDLLGALHRAVDEQLTAHQRMIFVAIVLNDVPLDTLVIELSSNRNAIYKALFDARRKLRATLAANGYIGDHFSRGLWTVGQRSTASFAPTRAMWAAPRRWRCCTSMPSWRPLAILWRSATPASPRTCARAVRAGRTSRGCWPRCAANSDDRRALAARSPDRHPSMPAAERWRCGRCVGLCPA